MAGKLDPKWLRQYTVIEILPSGSYKMKDNHVKRNETVVSPNQVKLYFDHKVHLPSRRKTSGGKRDSPRREIWNSGSHPMVTKVKYLVEIRWL